MIVFNSLSYIYHVLCVCVCVCVCDMPRLLTLPYHIGDLHRLTELHIRNNCIKFLPASILHLQLYTFTGECILLAYVFQYHFTL